MISEISAVLSSLKAAGDIAQGLNAAISQTQIAETKISLQNVLIEAQRSLLAADSEQRTLLTRINDLEQEIVRLKNWDAEKPRYQLKALGTGAVVYAEKEGVENLQAPHWLCANCFNNGQKSFLQFNGFDRKAGGGRDPFDSFRCDACKGTIKVQIGSAPARPR